MEPRRARVAPELDRWSRRAGGAGRTTTAVVRIAAGADHERAAVRLASIGMAVESSGPSSVTGQVSPTVLRLIDDEAWVVAVEAPRTLRPLAQR